MYAPLYHRLQCKEESKGRNIYEREKEGRQPNKCFFARAFTTTKVWHELAVGGCGEAEGKMAGATVGAIECCVWHEKAKDGGIKGRQRVLEF
jgi:hypothetical protein